jgi:hypothetical protein
MSFLKLANIFCQRWQMAKIAARWVDCPGLPWEAEDNEAEDVE